MEWTGEEQRGKEQFQKPAAQSQPKLVYTMEFSVNMCFFSLRMHWMSFYSMWTIFLSFHSFLFLLLLSFHFTSAHIFFFRLYLLRAYSMLPDGWQTLDIIYSVRTIRTSFFCLFVSKLFISFVHSWKKNVVLVNRTVLWAQVNVDRMNASSEQTDY